MGGFRYINRQNIGSRGPAWIAALPTGRRLPSLPNLERSALLLIDLQRYFGDPGSHAFIPALDAILPNVLALADAFGAAQRPVILTRHADPTDRQTEMKRFWRGSLPETDPHCELLDDLAEIPADLVLTKGTYSAFHHTDLEQWLRTRGCDTVVIAGVLTHLCCETTARHAFMLDLKPVLVADACASTDETLHLGALRNLAHGFAPVLLAEETIRILQGGKRPSPGPPAAAPTRCELAIVGAGPAGIAAAIQARRSGLDTMVLDGGPLGGGCGSGEAVNNYPGFAGGIGGTELMGRFVAHFTAENIPFFPTRVERLDRDGTSFLLDLGEARVLRADAVIVATGCRPLAPSLPGNPRTHLQIQELSTVKGQDLLLVGGGETALDQALLARRLLARDVTVAARHEISAMALLKRRCEEQDIRLLDYTELLQTETSNAAAIHCTLQGPKGLLSLTVDAIVARVGQSAQLPTFGFPLRQDVDSGEIETDKLCRTSVPGLYLVGDAGRGRYRQIGIAVGDGLGAAMHARDYLRPKPEVKNR